VTPHVASIMELQKGSLASLEKRLLGKKDPHHAGSARVPSGAHPDAMRKIPVFLCE
jgi:hypothetical protein